MVENMKKIHIIIITILIVVGFGVWFAYTKNGGNIDIGRDEQKAVRIGLITPLSGQYAVFGEVNKNAAQMAVEYFGTSTVELFVEDDAYDSKKAVSAYKKLKTMNNIEAVIVLGAPSIQAIKPLSDADNIPLLGLGATLVYEKDSVFQLMPPGDNMMPTAGKIYSEKYSRIALVGNNAELFKLNITNLKKGLDAKDIVYEATLPSSMDYRTEVAKILKSNPEVVTVAFPLEEAIKFLKALNTLDTSRTVKIVCDWQAELSTKEYVQAAGADRLEGCLATGIPETADASFKEKYATKYGIPLQLTGDFTFDAIGILVELSKKVSPNAWVATLADADYVYDRGVSGLIRFNDDGTRIDQEPKISHFKNGKFEAYLGE